jgi:hypothetical protein
LAELVVAAPVTDEDQRHQADTQRESDEDAQNYREPTGGADMRAAGAEPHRRDHDENR